MRIRVASGGSKARRAVARAIRRLPPTQGEPVELRLWGALTASRGRLLENMPVGTPVHAGSNLRSREMVMEAALVKHPAEFERVFVHEVFHFVWVRLGNPLRRSYEALLAREMAAGARGELGWSAELRKQALTGQDATTRSRRWREYACESFCDTAAWLYATSGRHPEQTLAARWRELRRLWFQDLCSRPLKI